MLAIFRKIALLEGISTIALFLVAMPLKYLVGWDALIFPVGMIHGVLFLAYIAAMILGLRGKQAGAFGWLRTFIASLFPFGTFLNDPFVKRLGDDRRVPA